MVGLMQIMIYLFCVYLVYKGFEIFQTAFVSKPENEKVRKTGIALGILSIIAAAVIGVIAVSLTDGMAAKIGNSMPNAR